MLLSYLQQDTHVNKTVEESSSVWLESDDQCEVVESCSRTLKSDSVVIHGPVAGRLEAVSTDRGKVVPT